MSFALRLLIELILVLTIGGIALWLLLELTTLPRTPKRLAALGIVLWVFLWVFRIYLGGGQAWR